MREDAKQLSGNKKEMKNKLDELFKEFQRETLTEVVIE